MSSNRPLAVPDEPGLKVDVRVLSPGEYFGEIFPSPMLCIFLEGEGSLIYDGITCKADQGSYVVYGKGFALIAPTPDRQVVFALVPMPGSDKAVHENLGISVKAFHDLPDWLNLNRSTASHIREAYVLAH